MKRVKFKQNFVMFVETTNIDTMYGGHVTTKVDQRHVQADTIMSVIDVYHITPNRVDILFADELIYKEVARNVESDYIEELDGPISKTGSCCGG